MKRTYETPVAEKVSFNYQEQIAASQCKVIWINQGEFNCTSGNKYYQPYDNV